MTTPKADETSYLWENIPRELWQRARAKALTERRHMKDILLELLSGWTDDSREGERSNGLTPEPTRTEPLSEAPMGEASKQ